MGPAGQRSAGRRAALAAALLLALAAAWLLAAPVPIDPLPWGPPTPREARGVWAPNRGLAAVERLGAGAGRGYEDVALDAAGRIYGGAEDGRIVRFAPDGGSPELFARTGGRPLGLDFDAAGSLLVADADRGLLAVAADGTARELAASHEGQPLRFLNDVEAAPDGTVYVSHASARFPLDRYVLDLMEHRPSGSLLAWSPASGELTRVLDGLWFANGVAVDPGGTFVLVCETGKYRVRRLWLAGERAGEWEVFIDNLPGFPDGISRGEGGLFWLALITPRQPLVDGLLLERPFLRKVVVRLPPALWPGPERYGYVLGLDAAGRVIHNLQDPEGGFAQVSSVQEHGGFLYLGSLAEDSIGRLPRPAAGDAPGRAGGMR